MRPAAEETPRSRIPLIIGTGFIVDEGLVVTNDHVIKAFDTLPRVEGGRGHPGVYANVLDRASRGGADVGERAG